MADVTLGPGVGDAFFLHSREWREREGDTGGVLWMGRRAHGNAPTRLERML